MKTLLKKIFKQIEVEMAAVAFSEEGEFDMARQLLNENKPRKTDRPSKHNYQRPEARIELHAD